MVFSLCILLGACPKPKPAPSPSLEPSLAPTPSQATITPSPVPATPSPIPTNLPFDPKSITQQMKDEAFGDISALFKELNRITQQKDYPAWRSYLSDEFITENSNPQLLADMSQRPVLKYQGINLRNLKDYFEYVVYPSHQNDRVDDIEFIGHNRVKAITRNKKGESFVLWYLVKIGDSWKIGIWR